MNKLPAWLKMLKANLLFAILYGASQFLLYVDKASTSRMGIG